MRKELYMLRCFLGVDVGTTALKVIAAEHTGRIIARSYEEYPLSHPRPDWAEQDAEIIWKTLLKEVEKVSKQMTPQQREGIRGIALSTQRSTMVPVDSAGVPLRKAITWMDGRSGTECAALAESVGKETVYQNTGNTISTIWTLSYILWLRSHERELFEETSCFANIHAFLMRRLGCDGYYLDYSNAGETMMFDPLKKTWSSRMLDYAGVDESKLPKLVDSGKMIGILDKELAQRWGVPETVRLISGGGDQQCAALGCSVAEEGDISIGMGTAANILALSASCLKDRESILIANPSVLPGKWFLEGSMIACGPILNWVKDMAYQGEPADCVYQVMNEEAERLSVPGAHGVMLLPHFQGAGCPYWNEKARGVFSGITLSTLRADLVRAVFEGLALDIGKSLQKLGENGIRPKRIFLTGGASKSDVWCQIQSDIYGLPVFVPQNPDVAAIGALILAALGEGTIDTLQKGMDAFVRIKKKYEPDLEKHRFYQSLMKESDDLYRRIAGV